MSTLTMCLWDRFLQFYASIGWILAVFGSNTQYFGLQWDTHDGNQMNLRVMQKVLNDEVVKKSKNR